MSARGRPGPRRLRGVVALWVVAAVVLFSGWGLFLYRGLVPGTVFASDDFRVIYCSSRAWLFGKNPYVAEDLDGLWRAANGPTQNRPSLRGSRDLLYPPPTFVLTAPVSAVDWPVAREAWAQINFVAIGVSLISMVMLLGVKWSHPSTWIFVGAALAFAPWITGIKVGQTSLVLVALVVGGHALRVRGGPVSGAIACGLLLGLAAVLKPQIGLVFIAYEVFRWRWRVAGPALVVAGVVTAAGIWRLEAAGVPWAESLSANVRAFTTGDGAGNPLPENEHRYQMIDFRPIAHNFTDNRALGALAAFGVAGLMALTALPAWLKRQEDSREMLALSIGATASLLIVYHRFYDAAVLLIPLGWVVWALVNPEGKRFGITRWLVLLGLLPFFVPGAAALYSLTRSGRVPAWLGENVLWNTLVVHHQAWSLIWLLGAMALAMGRAPRRDKPAFAWMGRAMGEGVVRAPAGKRGSTAR